MDLEEFSIEFLNNFNINIKRGDINIKKIKNAKPCCRMNEYNIIQIILPEGKNELKSLIHELCHFLLGHLNFEIKPFDYIGKNLTNLFLDAQIHLFIKELKLFSWKYEVEEILEISKFMQANLKEFDFLEVFIIAIFCKIYNIPFNTISPLLNKIINIIGEDFIKLKNNNIYKSGVNVNYNQIDNTALLCFIKIIIIEFEIICYGKKYKSNSNSELSTLFSEFFKNPYIREEILLINTKKDFQNNAIDSIKEKIENRKNGKKPIADPYNSGYSDIGTFPYGYTINTEIFYRDGFNSENSENICLDEDGNEETDRIGILHNYKKFYGVPTYYSSEHGSILDSKRLVEMLSEKRLHTIEKNLVYPLENNHTDRSIIIFTHVSTNAIKRKNLGQNLYNTYQNLISVLNKNKLLEESYHIYSVNFLLTCGVINNHGNPVSDGYKEESYIYEYDYSRRSPEYLLAALKEKIDYQEKRGPEKNIRYLPDLNPLPFSESDMKRISTDEGHNIISLRACIREISKNYALKNDVFIILISQPILGSVSPKSFVEYTDLIKKDLKINDSEFKKLFILWVENEKVALQSDYKIDHEAINQFRNPGITDMNKIIEEIINYDEH